MGCGILSSRSTHVKQGATEMKEAEDVPPEFAPGQLRRGVEVVQAYRVGRGSTMFVVSAGSVCDFEGDAMVNAANEGCITGGGVDGEVSNRGGKALMEARRALPIKEGTRAVRCPTGEARITIGGNLKQAYCIHAVGPNYCAMMDDKVERYDEWLFSAYRDSMARAQEKALKTVAFSLLSSGIFRGSQSLSKVLRLGALGILEGVYPDLAEVHMVAFTANEQRALQEVCSSLFSEGVFSSSPRRPSGSPFADPDSPMEEQAAQEQASGGTDKVCEQAAEGHESL
jgi:O-acetyl-ADP-ribose deacetylase (regulator of RNase III)